MFTGRWTGLEHVRWRVRGQLRRRVQRIFTAGGSTIATHVRAVAALASPRSSQEVRYDDGQSGPSDEQPPAKPQSIGKFTEGGAYINVFGIRICAGVANGGGSIIIYNIFLFYQSIYLVNTNNTENSFSHDPNTLNNPFIYKQNVVVMMFASLVILYYAVLWWWFRWLGRVRSGT